MEFPPKYCAFSSLLRSPLDKMSKRCDQHESNLRIAQLGLRLHAHRHATGTYPESLDVLGGDIQDPVAMKPYTYKTADGDYQLYSLDVDDIRDDSRTSDDTIWRIAE